MAGWCHITNSISITRMRRWYRFQVGILDCTECRWLCNGVIVLIQEHCVCTSLCWWWPLGLKRSRWKVILGRLCFTVLLNLKGLPRSHLVQCFVATVCCHKCTPAVCPPINKRRWYTFLTKLSTSSGMLCISMVLLYMCLRKNTNVSEICCELLKGDIAPWLIVFTTSVSEGYSRCTHVCAVPEGVWLKVTNNCKPQWLRSTCAHTWCFLRLTQLLCFVFVKYLL